MTGCATDNNDGVRTNQTRYNANSLNPNGYTMNNGMNANANNNGIRSRALNEYNNSYGTNRNYAGSGNNGMHPNHLGMNANGNGNGGYNRDISQKIEKHVSSIQGVDRATVVVYGKDVIVGLNAKGGGNTNALTNKVRKAVQDVQPGYNVHVTTDNNLNTRIRTLNTDLTPAGLTPMDGRPVQDFANDVGELITDMGRAITAPFR